MNREKHKRIVNIFQLICLIVLSYFLIQSVDVKSFQEIISDLDWTFFTLSVFLIILYHLVNITRWYYITKPSIIRYYVFVIYYGYGIFSNNFLPTGMGGDFTRILLLRKHINTHRATFSVALDRSIGLIALSFLIIYGSITGFPVWLIEIFLAITERFTIESIAIICLLLIVSGIGCYFFRGKVLTKINQFYTKFSNNKTLSANNLLIKGLVAYFYSVFALILLVITYWCIFQSLGVSAPVSMIVWLIVMVSLALLLPVTINGLGLQESVFVMVLSNYGITTTMALAIALLVRALQVISSLLGGALMLIRVGEKNEEQYNESTYS
jgi:glycosyltransferase 2 family protein